VFSLELAHLGVVVSNCAKSEQFYCEVLGCTLSERWQSEDLNAVNLNCGELIIELLEYRNPANQVVTAGIINHLAFKVSDIDAMIEQLTKLGVAFETAAPKILPNGKKIIFFHGPDGERIELMEEQ